MRILNLFLQIFSAIFLGLTISLALQEGLGYGSLAFIFILILVAWLVFRLLKTWNVFSNLVFLFICILIGMLLRMYIMLAP